MLSIYDIDTKTHIANISMTSVETYHCNNISFGSEKYDSDDLFPLLYISMENSTERKALAYRIQYANDAYSATLVQTITFPALSDDGIYYPNCAVDAVNNLMCIIGYTENSFIKSDTNKIKIVVYNLPLLSEGNVQLSYADKLKTASVSSLTATQGALFSGDRIVQLYGNGSQPDTNTFLGQVSITSNVFTTLINLKNIGLTVEPEAIFTYNRNMYIVFIDRKIYKIFLD